MYFHVVFIGAAGCQKFFSTKLVNYQATVGTMDVEAIRMILPSADLGAFLGQRA
jgi:hypothetical protein